ncbi:hypothetical protein EWM62_02120 [Mucilaginibacter terrigena]|uniref:Uncharacterized protein n=1 Tax=Mucilaginibacter terrigena TaxID=2492395 RepID=A0A4Q5LS87_9SPHI|nr:hypothetical protein [Mucilaginibacter terrigena]RYU92253.1 hypothetical protein EWM62_02120 [Mucilaginibacter terrigena]
MAKDYLKEKVVKKKSASTAGWLLVILGLIFAILLGKFALSGSVNMFTGLPDSDAAYTVAKQFIIPTTLSKNIKFSDSEYKFAKKSDSVYVIKSFYTAKDDVGETSTTQFTITLKYNGGAGAKTSNWTLINLDQDN